ncbi:MAG: hypothetical protein NW207_13030 [Cytophagales bacterium]|nr:hypothetical protein [Cytophagales bacterium]
MSKNIYSNTITGASYNTRYRMGQVLTFVGIAKDSVGNITKKNNFIWRAHYRHEDHWHDNLLNASQDSIFLFALPQKGEFTARVFYRIELIVPYGIKKPYDTTYYDILPDTSKVTFKSIPDSIEFKIFGTSLKTEYTFYEVENAVLPVSFAETQTISGVEYIFKKWSFGSTVSGQLFNTPVNDTTFIIEFIPKPTVSGLNPTTTGHDFENQIFIPIFTPNPFINRLKINLIEDEYVIEIKLTDIHAKEISISSYKIINNEIIFYQINPGYYIARLHTNKRKLNQLIINTL